MGQYAKIVEDLKTQLNECKTKITSLEEENSALKNQVELGTSHILRKHFYSTKLNLNSLIVYDYFFRQNERISFSTLYFDEIFML